jgi:hypothetical protein
MRVQHFMPVLILVPLLVLTGCTLPQTLKGDPTPQDYIERNGGGATIVPPGQLVLDGHHMSCENAATILDPNLDDYGKSYPQFVILNSSRIDTVPTPVKLWIYSHECGHLVGGADENKADCSAVKSGREAGWLDARGLDEVCNFISAAHADTAHFGGTDRCKLMRACFTQPGMR